MEEVTGTIGGFRAAIQDLLVPELKALQVEVRNLKETLERHEQIIFQLSKDQAERFAAMQQENNDRFNAVMNAIRDLQQNISSVMMQMNFTEKIHQLELQMARMNKTGNPIAF